MYSTVLVRVINRGTIMILAATAVAVIMPCIAAASGAVSGQVDLADDFSLSWTIASSDIDFKLSWNASWSAQEPLFPTNHARAVSSAQEPSESGPRGFQEPSSSPWGFKMAPRPIQDSFRNHFCHLGSSATLRPSGSAARDGASCTNTCLILVLALAQVLLLGH